jgi:threonine dehydrogenase-like Zn-dependent dehydrogenase
MKYAKFLGDRTIRIDSGLGDFETQEGVTLQVLACALCGSDLRPWQKGWPRTPGHEIVARVDDSAHPLSGTRVAVYIPVWCGQCEQCKLGNTHLCCRLPDIELIGWQRSGGYAERLKAPVQCLLPVPDEVPTELAPLLLDTIGTTAHGIRLMRRLVQHGPALVIGAGPIGLGAIVALLHMDFGPVYVTEPVAHRRDVAASLGALPLSPEEINRRFPVVVETSGKDAGRQLGLNQVAPLGVCLQLGEADRWDVEENRRMRLKDFFYLRSFYFPIGEYQENIDMLLSNVEMYKRLVDDRVPLEGLGDLFHAFSRGERIKPLMMPESAK